MSKNYDDVLFERRGRNVFRRGALEFYVNDLDEFRNWYSATDLSGYKFRTIVFRKSFGWGYISQTRKGEGLKALVLSQLLSILCSPLSLWLVTKGTSKAIVLKPSRRLPIKYGSFLSTIKFLVGRRGKGQNVVRWDHISWSIAQDLSTSGYKVKIVSVPVFLLPYTLTRFNYNQNFFIPHLSLADFTLAENRVQFRFYNQEILPWCYTVNEKGWGRLAGSTDPKRPGLEVSELIANTKYPISERGQNCHGPFGNNCLVLLGQLPNDKSIAQNYWGTYFDFVQAVCEFAFHSGRTVVLKSHPLIGESHRAAIESVVQAHNGVVSNESLAEVFDRYDEFAVLSSGAGIEAIARGLSVFVFGAPSYRHLGLGVCCVDGAWQIAYPSGELESYLKKYETLDDDRKN